MTVFYATSRHLIRVITIIHFRYLKLNNHVTNAMLLSIAKNCPDIRGLRMCDCSTGTVLYKLISSQSFSQSVYPSRTAFMREL